MAEWIHTNWQDLEPEGDVLHTKFRDTWCRWHHWTAKQRNPRGVRREDAIADRHGETEHGRRPYVDGSNWGVKSTSEKRSGKVATERSLRKRRLSHGKKV